MFHLAIDVGVLCRPFHGLAMALLFTFHCQRSLFAADSPGWHQLFNGKDLSGWDKWLGPKSGGYSDKATSKEPALGLNDDPFGVSTLVQKSGEGILCT